MLGGVKLDNTLLTCDKGNFNQITAWSRNRTLVTVVRDMCTTTGPTSGGCDPSKYSLESPFIQATFLFTLLSVAGIGGPMIWSLDVR